MTALHPTHVKPQDLVEAARLLAKGDGKKPKHAFLRRSVSTAYYAMFHTLARCCADMLIGAGRERSKPAWTQVYRSLEHGFAKNQCQSARISSFPRDIQDFAQLFATIQKTRHDADYDPAARFSRSSVLVEVARVEAAIRAFDRVAGKDKRAFAAFVLLKGRRD